MELETELEAEGGGVGGFGTAACSASVLGSKFSSWETCLGRYASMGRSRPLAAKNMAAAERGTRMGSSAATRTGEREGGAGDASVLAAG